MTKKVYSISTGSYSDYQVRCLFTSRRKARQFIKKWDIFGRYDKPYIQELVLDPSVPEDIGERSTYFYSMRINPNTDEIEVCGKGNFSPGKLGIIDKEIVDIDGQPPYWAYKFTVEASNREGAIKIAREIYMRAKAMNELPDINQLIIREAVARDWIKFGKVKITFSK